MYNRIIDEERKSTQQNSYSISHLLGTVTRQSWYYSPGVVAVDNCHQHSDYTVDDDYTINVQSLCGHCA